MGKERGEKRILTGKLIGKIGQVSIEYLMIVGFTILLLFPMIYLFYTNSSSFESDVAAAKAEQAAQKIIDAADTVYYLGEPSQQTLALNFPSGVNSVSINGSAISFHMSSATGKYEIVKWGAANLTGNISLSQGVHRITVKAASGGVVIDE